MENEVTIPLGNSITITRLMLKGWNITVPVSGVNKSIAFTDSVDLIDWLNNILIQSDGGKKSNG